MVICDDCDGDVFGYSLLKVDYYDRFIDHNGLVIVMIPYLS